MTDISFFTLPNLSSSMIQRQGSSSGGKGMHSSKVLTLQFSSNKIPGNQKYFLLFESEKY